MRKIIGRLCQKESNKKLYWEMGSEEDFNHYWTPLSTIIGDIFSVLPQIILIIILIIMLIKILQIV
jgi:hypothetical protein